MMSDNSLLLIILSFILYTLFVFYYRWHFVLLQCKTCARSHRGLNLNPECHHSIVLFLERLAKGTTSTDIVIIIIIISLPPPSLSLSLSLSRSLHLNQPMLVTFVFFILYYCLSSELIDRTYLVVNH